MPTARIATRAVLTGSLAGLMACAGGDGAEDPAKARPTYLGAEVTDLADGLIQVRLSLGGTGGRAAVDDYARCMAAGRAVRTGAGFLRPIRTLAGKEGGIWRADAVYSVSAALPGGLTTIDAEVTVEECTERRIPTE